jgi:hypothetical protein
MRHQRPLTLLVVLALAGGLSACGSDDELATPVPKTAPDLTIPTATTEARPGDTSSPSTTTSTTTTGTTSAVTPPASATPPATPPPAAAPPPASTTGGQTPAQGQPTTGGTQANGGEFENFCSENPGAC